MESKFTLRTYAAFIFAAGIVSLFSLLIIPGDLKNAFWLGYSIQRLVLIAGNVFALLGLGLFYWKVLKDEKLLLRINRNIENILEKDRYRTSSLFLFGAGFIGGCYALILTFRGTDPYLGAILGRLAPWFFLLTSTFLGGIFFLVLNDLPSAKAHVYKHWRALLLLLIILSVGVAMHSYLWGLPKEFRTQEGNIDLISQKKPDSEDIYFIYLEGVRLEEGENPYARVLALPDLTENNKNATYLPVTYVLTWAMRAAGLKNFPQFLTVWRVIALVFNMGIVYLLFYIPYFQYNSLPFGAFAALFWILNRWVLNVTLIYHIEFLPIFFFLLSLASWPRHRVVSLLSFGLSLAIKQFALFMIPVYLIWIWQSLEDRSLKKLIGLSLVMISIPLITSFPFIIWNAEGFFKSILISATRNAASHFRVPSIDVLIGLSGIPARLPMLGMITGIYVLAWKNRINKYTTALLIMSIVVDFNSVLFSQYMAWIVPLVPLAACSWKRKLHENAPEIPNVLTPQGTSNLH